MTVTTILTEDQTSHFIPCLIKENHSRRPWSISFNDFAVRDSGMLALLVGDNHIKFAVFFHDVDALDINFAELLFAALQCESGE